MSFALENPLALAASLLALLLRATVQGSIALVLVWLLVHCWPAMPARLRPWLWRLACLKLVLGLLFLPVLCVPLLPTAPAPDWRGSLPDASAPFALAKELRARPPTEVAPALVSLPGPAVHEKQAAAQIPLVLLGMWMVLVTIASLRAVVSWRRIVLVRLASQPLADPAVRELLGSLCVRMGLRRVPDLRIAAITTPLLTGFVHPVILLPQNVVETRSSQELAAIFGHELAHIRRGDILWGWLYLLNSVLFCFDPLVWLTRREWLLAQEIACDADVVGFMDLPEADYARLLVSIAACRDSGRLPALGVMDAYRTLERRVTMLAYVRKPKRLHVFLAGLLLALTALLCLTPWSVTAQTTISSDGNVRLAQQWEDVLLLEATDYLQLTPQQYSEMRSMVDYARSRMEEVDRQRAILKTMVQDQHEALLQGKRPTASEQLFAIQKEKSIKEMEERISGEIVNRLTPRLTALLTRKQVARAWQLVRGRTPKGEAQRVALYDPDSGFVLGDSEANQLQEDLVRIALRQTHSNDVLNAALDGGGATSMFMQFMTGALQSRRIAMDYRPTVLDKVVVSPAEDGAVIVQTGDSVIPETAPLPEVSQSVRDGIYQEAAQIRNALDNDPDTYLKKAPSDLLISTMRHLTKRMFLSPRLKEALEERALRKGL